MAGVIAAGIIGLLIGGVGGYAIGSGDEEQAVVATTTTAAEASSPNVRLIATQHNLPATDGNQDFVSMNFDGIPSRLAGFLDELGFNGAAVVGRMENTRALDGTLTADGDGVRASWTYHPDDGLNLVVEVVD